MRIGFIGAGKVGCSLGKYFKESVGDWQIEGYLSRSTESAKEAAVFTDSRVIDQVELLAQMSDVVFIIRKYPFSFLFKCAPKTSYEL